ncbi:hypothetical protein ABN034_13305 [Actinopolymorpha sp. B11F2]
MSTSKNAAPAGGSFSGCIGASELDDSGDFGDSGDVELGDVELGDVEPGDVEPGDVGLGDCERGDFEPGDFEPGDVDPADVDPADVDPADVDPADVDPADVDLRVLPDLAGFELGDLDPGGCEPGRSVGPVDEALRASSAGVMWTELRASGSAMSAGSASAGHGDVGGSDTATSAVRTRRRRRFGHGDVGGSASATSAVRPRSVAASQVRSASVRLGPPGMVPHGRSMYARLADVVSERAHRGCLTAAVTMWEPASGEVLPGEAAGHFSTGARR